MKQEHQNGPGQQIELDHGRLQEPTAGAASREKPDSQPNQQVVGGIPAAVFVEHDFEGRLVRTLLKAGEPWFVAADVCRALQLVSHKGSHAAHLDKLDDDEKLQISREAIVAAAMTPGLKVDDIVVDALARLGARAARADDPLGVEKGPMAWVVSESGLYTLILRSREATTRGTLAHRFRRWVTGEVLPSIRRTGSYSVAGCGADTVTLSLREAARYIVMVVPGRPPHVRRTRYEAILGEHTALDNQILCAGRWPLGRTNHALPL